MKGELKGWEKPRPFRVAFLVREGEHSALQLDGIFADCYSRWGGRFSLIIPCTDVCVPEAYWAWLEAFDPDIVYSYVPLDRAHIVELHERLSIGDYEFHQQKGTPRLDVHGFKPNYKFRPLSSLSVVFRLARYRPSSTGAAPIKIIDSWHSERPSRFLSDNFGTYHLSADTGLFPTDAMAAASLLTILTTPDAGGPKQGVPASLETVPTELAAFIEFAHQRATSHSVASLLFASKLEIHSRQFGSSFNLVVGDSFSDRILFWNARLFIPAWLDNDIYCLRVSPSQLDDADFLSAIGDLIKRRNHVNGGAGGQSQLTVRSTSLTEAQLGAAADRIRSTKPWSNVSVQQVGSVDALIPTTRELQSAKESHQFSDALFSRPDWTEFSWLPPSAAPPHVSPDHLTDAPPRQSFTLGLWATDFTFEYGGVSLRFSERNRWALPNRWRFARAFNPSFGGSPLGSLPPPPRRSRDGRLTQFVGVDRPLQSVEVPTIEKAVRQAFCIDGAYAKPDAEHGKVYPGNKVVWVRPSNEAGYLTGVMGLAGGFESATAFFLHPYLAQVFASLGGTPKLSAKELGPTTTRLANRSARFPMFDIREDQERSALARLVVLASKDFRRPLDFAKYSELHEQWRTYRKEYWEAQGGPPDGDTSIDWDAREQGLLDDCLIALRQRQILFQGYQWTCGRCHHRNWIGFEKLRSELTCEVCKTAEPAPVAIEWLFRPNEFLIESLRSHSVLSLLWVLDALRQQSRFSFQYEGPLWFGFDPNSDKPSAEADLLVISDGKTILCEVKSSWRGLRKLKFAEFVELARRLRPNVAILAVMEDGLTLAEEIGAAKSLLSGEGIELSVLTPRNHSNHDDIYLPS